MCCPMGTVSSSSPHGVVSGCEVSGGPPVGAERGELGLPCLFTRLPEPPGLRHVQQGLAPLLEFVGAQGLALLVHSRDGRPPGFDEERYKKRNTVERAINRLRHARAVATRYDQRGYVFRGPATVAALVIRLRT